MEAVRNVLSNLIPSGGASGGVPEEPTASELNDLKQKYVDVQQDQVFAFYDSLSAPEKAALYKQLSTFDLPYISQVIKKVLSPPQSDAAKKPVLEPLPEAAKIGRAHV